MKCRENWRRKKAIAAKSLTKLRRKLAARGQLRKWHASDMKAFLGLPKRTDLSHGHDPEFQQWFAVGMRKCEKHDYPVVWHIAQRLDCYRCAAELESTRQKGPTDD